MNETEIKALLEAVRCANDEIKKIKEIARMAPENEYKEGYLHAITNAIHILDEYLISKYCR